MGELWDLEKLAEKCKEEGRYTFFLTSAPDNVSGEFNPITCRRPNLLTTASRKCWKSSECFSHLLKNYELYWVKFIH
jgi:hypothetical protein